MNDPGGADEPRARGEPAFAPLRRGCAAGSHDDEREHRRRRIRRRGRRAYIRSVYSLALPGHARQRDLRVRARSTLRLWTRTAAQSNDPWTSFSDPAPFPRRGLSDLYCDAI